MFFADDCAAKEPLGRYPGGHNPHIVAGVLAGGGSRRYGKDKAFVEWKGKPLVEHALEAASSIAQETYILSKEPDKFEYLPYSVIPDFTGTPTPISGIISVSPFVKERLLLFACDILLLDYSFLDTLQAAAREGYVVVPKTNMGLQPLLALYPKSVLPIWEKAFIKGNYKLRHIVEEMPHIPVITEEGRKLESKPPFININRPEDLIEYQKTCARESYER